MTDTGYVLIAYAFSGIPGTGSDAVIIGRTETEEEAHWMFAEACTHADKKRLAIYSRRTGWRMSGTVFSVRPANHPHATAAQPDGCPMILAPGSGLRNRRDALRRWGTRNGYRGNGGGWVSRVGYSSIVGQGWGCLDLDEMRRPDIARVINVGGSHRVAEKRLLTPAELSNRLVSIAIS